MDRKRILAQINQVFRDTLDNDLIHIQETTQAMDIDEWDSLTHIMLVVAIEKELKIRFTSSEINSWRNIGAMIDTILPKFKN